MGHCLNKMSLVGGGGSGGGVRLDRSSWSLLNDGDVFSLSFLSVHDSRCRSDVG